jgi:hypothetical protein
VIRPAYLSIPPRLGSRGDEAVDLAADAGRVLDEEQRLGVDALLSYGPGGRWVALEQCVIEARQNGKSGGILLPVVLWDLWLSGVPDRVVWTAHRFKTAQEAFDDFVKCIETSAVLSRRVKSIDRSHGEEAIELMDGSKLEFLARNSGGGRGLGGKRVVMDEALFLAAGSMGALMPTLSARPDPQITYGSSAAKATSDHLHKLVQRGRKGGDPSLIHLEWCAPGSWEDPGCDQGRDCTHMPGVAEGCAMDREELWPLAGHTTGKRITLAYIRGERRALTPTEFGRERMGWHEIPSEAGGQIDAATWEDLLDQLSRRTGDVALALDVSPDRAFAAIALYGQRADGDGHLQLMKYDGGNAWVIRKLVELRDALGDDLVAVGMGKGTFTSLKDALKRADFVEPEDPERPERGALVVASGLDMAAACGQLLDAVAQRTLHHTGQDQLTTAVLAGKVRQGNESVSWTRKDKDSPVDITPLVAATVARWAFITRVDLVDQEVEPWFDTL